MLRRSQRVRRNILVDDEAETEDGADVDEQVDETLTALDVEFTDDADIEGDELKEAQECDAKRRLIKTKAAKMREAKRANLAKRLESLSLRGEQAES